MKFLFLSVSLLICPAFSSQLSLRAVKQPLYLHGSDTNAIIEITDVPIVSYYADPEWRFSAISKPFIPASDGSWKTPHDINLASLYSIKVLGAYAANNRDIEVVIDASEAQRPKGYPFSIADVIDSTSTCVKLMYPPRPETEGRLEIKIVLPQNQD